MRLVSGQLSTPIDHFNMEIMEFSVAYAQDMLVYCHPAEESLLEAFDVLSFTILEPTFVIDEEVLLRIFNTFVAYRDEYSKPDNEFYEIHEQWVAKKLKKYPRGNHMDVDALINKLEELMVKAGL